MDYAKYLVEKIHTVILATSDSDGQPVTCALDIMDYDEHGLYFLTAKGKSLYRRLKKNGFAALTGIKGDSTLTCTAVSVRGKTEELGNEYIARLFEKNSYMKEIYPSAAAERRRADILSQKTASAVGSALKSVRRNALFFRTAERI